ncbi:MAG TPA: DPP IV N-terminal domain-containing protein, partial [Vicinamibacteria bacterium]
MVAVLALACALPAQGQALQKLTVERIHAEPSLEGDLPADLAWTPDGRRVTWLKPGSRGAPADLWALEANSGQEALLVVGSRVQVPGSGSVLPLRGYTWLPSGDALLVAHGGDLFVVNVAQASTRTLVGTPEEEEFPELSPDGRRVAFVRKNDLYVVDVVSGRETRITRSGSDTILNGRLDWVYEEELGARSGRAFAWSPDSRKIAYLQLDQAQVPTFPIVDFVPAQNTVRLQRYPRPGDPNAVVRLGVVAVDREGEPGPERLVSFTPDDLYVVPQLAWSQDSATVAFQQLNREQNELALRVLAVPTSPSGFLGAPRTLLTERSPTWVNASPAPRFL